MNVFIYQWETNNDDLLAFALDEKNNTVCIVIQNFLPYFFVEVPDGGNVTSIDDTLRKKVFRVIEPSFHRVVTRSKLYYATGKNTHFIQYFFPNNSKFEQWGSIIRKSKLFIPGLGSTTLTTHETNISPILQYTCTHDLPMAGWVCIRNYEQSRVPITTCSGEFTVDYSGLTAIVEHVQTPSPVILGFDLEVYSDNPNRFPDAERQSDCIFQISCVFWSPLTEVNNYYLLTIGDVDENIIFQNDEIGDNICVHCFEDEVGLLEGLSNLILQYNPNIITGYNIFGFDLPYINTRARLLGIQDKFSTLGMIRNKECIERCDSWSSSAYGEQIFKYYYWDGRIVMDLMMYAVREIKAENYKLDTIAETILKLNKISFSHHEIFQAYEHGVLTPTSNGHKLLSQCGYYCIVDTHLVQKLFDKWDIWTGITEMAKVCNVPASYLYTRGQQIKVFSQVYKHCVAHEIVVDSGTYKCGANECYQGAYVKDPIPGIYEYVLPFDFKSLYPTLIVAYNIDYHTLVPENSTIEDSDCHVIEWSEQQSFDIYKCLSCKEPIEYRRNKTTKKWKSSKDPEISVFCNVCKTSSTFTFDNLSSIPHAIQKNEKIQLPQVEKEVKYKYRFLKSPPGVLPTIILNLLDARQNVRNNIKQLQAKLSKVSDDSEKNDLVCHINMLNQRQLSYKVSANSMYGVLGVRKGSLPLMPGAMCVTAKGRESLHKAAHHLISRYNAKWIYSDTDSTYVQFSHLQPTELWSFARKVEKEMLDEQIFPAPMMLEFENAVYDPFFILTMKRYMWKKYKEDGSRPDLIDNKGVALARRGTSQFLKDVYKHVVQMIFDKFHSDDVLYELVQKMNLCCSYSLPVENFIITKKIHDSESYNVQPAHSILAEIMIGRGTRVDVGERLEYVVVKKNKSQLIKVNGNIEHVDYQRKHNSVLRINHLYYIHLLMKQIDELLRVAYQVDKFVEKQYKLRLTKHKMLDELMFYFKPKIILL